MTTVLVWLLNNWRLLLVGLLVVALGVQTYRLQGVQGERDLLAQDKVERQRRDAMRDASNLRNKERTDAQTALDRKRAAAVVVRLDGPGIKPANPGELAPGGAGGLSCFDGGRLGAELDGWATRAAERLTAVLQRDAERLEAIARAGEEVAADYRACRAWAVNLQ